MATGDIARSKISHLDVEGKLFLQTYRHGDETRVRLVPVSDADELLHMDWWVRHAKGPVKAYNSKGVDLFLTGAKGEENMVHLPTTSRVLEPSSEPIDFGNGRHIQQSGHLYARPENLEQLYFT